MSTKGNRSEKIQMSKFVIKNVSILTLSHPADCLSTKMLFISMDAII